MPRVRGIGRRGLSLRSHEVIRQDNSNPMRINGYHSPLNVKNVFFSCAVYVSDHEPDLSNILTPQPIRR